MFFRLVIFSSYSELHRYIGKLRDSSYISVTNILNIIANNESPALSVLEQMNVKTEMSF